MNKFSLHLLFIIVALGLGGCQQNQTNESQNLTEDSTAIDTIQPIIEEEEAETPAAADMVFNDFIDEFINKKKFQLSRVQFPLSRITDGTEQIIAQKDWTYDPIYKGEDYYTMIFDGTELYNNREDSVPRKFTVERIDLNKGRVKQYLFNKDKGLWKLVGINEHFFKDNTNGEFYDFYAKFSSDAEYQRTHILSAFTFKTYDIETGEYIEGTLEPEQWQEVCPELPTGIITNFVSGEINPKSIKRTFTICSSSTEMNTTLEFRHWGGKWTLISLEQ